MAKLEKLQDFRPEEPRSAGYMSDKYNPDDFDAALTPATRPEQDLPPPPDTSQPSKLSEKIGEGIHGFGNMAFSTGASLMGGFLARKYGNVNAAAAFNRLGTSYEQRMNMRWFARQAEIFSKGPGQKFAQTMQQAQTRFTTLTTPIAMPTDPNTKSDEPMSGVGLPQYSPDGKMTGFIPLNSPEAQNILLRERGQFYQTYADASTEYLNQAGQYPTNPIIAKSAEAIFKTTQELMDKITGGRKEVMADQAAEMDFERAGMQLGDARRDRRLRPSDEQVLEKNKLANEKARLDNERVAAQIWQIYHPKDAEDKKNKALSPAAAMLEFRANDKIQNAYKITLNEVKNNLETNAKKPDKMSEEKWQKIVATDSEFIATNRVLTQLIAAKSTKTPITVTDADILMWMDPSTSRYSMARRLQESGVIAVDDDIDDAEELREFLEEHPDPIELLSTLKKRIAEKKKAEAPPEEPAPPEKGIGRSVLDYMGVSPEYSAEAAARKARGK